MFYLILALLPAVIGAAANQQMFKIAIDRTYNEHSSQAVVCMHDPKVKAVVIGIVSGDDAHVCQEICCYIQSRSHLAATTDSDSDEDFNGEDDYALTQDAEKNALIFHRNYYHARNIFISRHLKKTTKKKEPKWKAQRTYRQELSSTFLSQLPQQVSWVAITYDQKLNFKAHTANYMNRSLQKKIDISEKIVSNDYSLIFETDGHKISFEASKEDLERTVENDAWTCVIQ